MNENELDLIFSLRDRGFAVVVWTPEELLKRSKTELQKSVTTSFSTPSLTGRFCDVDA
jgi:hypothetical protein